MFRNKSLVKTASPQERGRIARAHDEYRGGGGRAFDAAGASGMAFLASQLEKLDTELVEPLQAVTHARDITVEVGGGFPEFISAYASNYTSAGTGQLGFQGTANTEIANVQADIQKGIWSVNDWAAAITVRHLDLKRMEFAQRTGIAPPFSLQELYNKACKTVWVKALDLATYNGVFGQPGLVNNPAVTEFVVVNGGSGTAWSTKTPAQILFDVNTMCNTVMANSGYDEAEGMPDRLLVPYTQWSFLTAPMTLGGVGGYESIKSYIERQCVASQSGRKFEIHQLPNTWISGKGAGGTDRAVCYRNTKESLYLAIPQPMTLGITVPTTRFGGAYESVYYGCVSQVVFKRTQTMVYADGI